jgi:hypothetical protein
VAAYLQVHFHDENEKSSWGADYERKSRKTRLTGEKLVGVERSKGREPSVRSIFSYKNEPGKKSC